MNFYGYKIIKYFMLKKRSVFNVAIIIALCVCVPILSVRLKSNKVANSESAQMTTLTLWHIDGFEGGRGSRKQFLQDKANSIFASKRCYVTVVSLTADAARENIERGQAPDMISYSPGLYGIENKINGKDFVCKCWAEGAYILFTLDGSSDFSDVSGENTIIDAGKDNLSEVSAMLNGIINADVAQPVNAYLKLIDGKYKYLFGTQRDYFRLKTRNISFKMKKMGAFNDMYQNISIITCDQDKYELCLNYVNYLTEESNGVGKLGLFYGNYKYLDDNLVKLCKTGYESVINFPCSKNYIDEIKLAAKNNDINKIKNLLK